MGEWGLCCLECAIRCLVFRASQPVYGRMDREWMSSLWY